MKQSKYSRLSPSRRGYGHYWQKLRIAYLQRNPLCVFCGKPAEHADHIKRLRDGGTHDESNLQALCHSCHSVKTQRERVDKGMPGADASGIPIDPSHHWNQ